MDGREKEVRSAMVLTVTPSKPSLPYISEQARRISFLLSITCSSVLALLNSMKENIQKKSCRKLHRCCQQHSPEEQIKDSDFLAGALRNQQRDGKDSQHPETVDRADRSVQEPAVHDLPECHGMLMMPAQDTGT